MEQESIPEDKRRFALNLDCRYVKQYHEVSFSVAAEAIREADLDTIAAAFHVEHKRMYGYSLEDEGVAIELINVRLRATGLTEKPAYTEEDYAGKDAGTALKGERGVYVPEELSFRQVCVYDGHKTRHGNVIEGPALIEQVNTTLLLTATYDCVCDKHGSFVVFRRGREDRLPSTLREMLS
jgi:N-methylhydantoinase A